MRKVLFLFGQLGDQDVDWLSRSGRAESAEPGLVLIHEGQDIEAMYILLEGRMRVDVRGIGAVAELQPGDVIGEMSFVSSLPTSADVVAVTTCKLFAVDRYVLQEHLSKDAEFSSRFYKSIAMLLADRLRGTTQRLGNTGGTAEPVDPDEADDNILDGLYIAGLRFERLVNGLGTRLG